MKKIYFLEAFKNIKQNLSTSVLLILCFILLFFIFSDVSIQTVLTLKASEDSEKISLIDYTQIGFASITSNSPRVLMEAFASLENDEIIAAGRAMDNIITTLREKYNAVENMHIRTLYSQIDSSLLGDFCSYDLYRLCSSILIIKEGKWFEKEDFNRYEQQKKGYIAPVILGAKFAEKYKLSVGDIFVADMFYDEEYRNFIDESAYADGTTYTWKVIGIFEPDSSFIYRGGINPVNNRVMLPEYETPTLDEVLLENNGEINDNVLRYITSALYTAFRTTDYYINIDDLPEALQYINNEIANDGFLSQYYIAEGSNSLVTMVAQNQKKASDFYAAVAIIIYVISSFGIIMSVINKIQNNKHNYAIHSLNGASVFDLIMCSVTEIVLLMFVADAFFFAVPYSIYYHRVNIGNGIYVGRETPLFVLTVNIITLLIAIIASVSVLSKFDTVSHLKERE